MPVSGKVDRSVGLTASSRRSLPALLRGPAWQSHFLII
jgi:hypothetical protein